MFFTICPGRESKRAQIADEAVEDYIDRPSGQIGAFATDVVPARHQKVEV